MGAVFALYSAWYFWIPKILGLEYNKSWGKSHFWILFGGVNVTFFPQHFLGLQGMPRRISDYPDAFAGWNLISSIGSIISVIATWMFLYILYVQLLVGKAISWYPWLIPQHCYDLLQTHLIRSFNSLEWGLDCPPKAHAFTSLPVQSSRFYKALTLLIPLTVSFGLYLAYRLPIRFMLGELNIIHYISLFNILVSLCLIVIIANLKGDKVKVKQIAYIVIIGLGTPVFTFFVGKYLNEFVTSFALFLGLIPQLLDSKATIGLSLSTSNNLGHINHLGKARPESISKPQILKMDGEASRGRGVPARGRGGLTSETGALVPTRGTGAVATPRGTSAVATPRGTSAMAPPRGIGAMAPPRGRGAGSGGPVTSGPRIPGLGTFQPESDLVQSGWWGRRDLTAVGAQDPPKSANLSFAGISLSMAEIRERYPNHVAGEGKGFGYLGANQGHKFVALLAGYNGPLLREFLNKIPPSKNEPMVGPRSEFWAILRGRSEGIGTTSEFPLFHKEPLVVEGSGGGRINHDTLIAISTDHSTREEKRQACLEIMETLKEVIVYPENRPTRTGEYWKYLHEFMAARHYYQLFLLDDNT